jgi:Arc/MetJ family transcription regulator
MARATVTINLDAELVIELMVLADIRNAQDAVEAAVRDYVAKAQRTDAVTGDVQDFRRPQADRRDQDTGTS